jgi:hypothetical protein
VDEPGLMCMGRTTYCMTVDELRGLWKCIKRDMINTQIRFL